MFTVQLQDLKLISWIQPSAWLKINDKLDGGVLDMTIYPGTTIWWMVSNQVCVMKCPAAGLQEGNHTCFQPRVGSSLFSCSFV